jgi:hypothetical protein
MPTQCTSELVARVGKNTNNNTMSIVRLVQSIQDHNWLMDIATVQQGSSSSSCCSNKNKNANHLSCKSDIDVQNR